MHFKLVKWLKCSLWLNNKEKVYFGYGSSKRKKKKKGGGVVSLNQFFGFVLLSLSLDISAFLPPK